MTIYNNISMARYISFDIVSSQKIDSFEINMETEIPYSYSLDKQVAEEIPYYVFQSYQNVDWSNNSTSDYMDEYNYYIDYISKNYHYRAFISFDLSDLTEDEVIKNITFNINGNELKKEIMGIKLNCSTENLFKDGVDVKTSSTSKWIVPNSEGKISIDNAQMVSSKDIEIIDFYVLGDSAKVTE